MRFNSARKTKKLHNYFTKNNFLSFKVHLLCWTSSKLFLYHVSIELQRAYFYGQSQQSQIFKWTNQIPKLFVAGGRAGKRVSKSDTRHDFWGLSSWLVGEGFFRQSQSVKRGSTHGTTFHNQLAIAHFCFPSLANYQQHSRRHGSTPFLTRYKRYVIGTVPVL